MSELDKMAIQAASDDDALEIFVMRSRTFIKKCAYKTSHKFITENDDEWSVALAAFVQAVRTFDETKGGFAGYAGLVIKRKLIDSSRERARYSAELSVSPEAFDGGIDDDSPEFSTQLEVTEKIASAEQNGIKDEISAANAIFSGYGFSFFDLADCSPKAVKTKEACAKAAAFMLRQPALISEMRARKLLPGKVIAKSTGVPQKILDRHRKYIIAVVEIFSSGMPCLEEYLSFVRKELGV